MTNASKFTVGWMDTTIHEFLAHVSPAENSRYALITCLDSSFDVASIFKNNPWLLPYQSEITFVDLGVLIETSKLQDITRMRRLFYGFDEVFFFGRTFISPKPTDISIVGPNRISAANLPVALETWMDHNDCSLGLGDGTGTNFIAKFSGVVKSIFDALGETVNQTGPTIQSSV